MEVATQDPSINAYAQPSNLQQRVDMVREFALTQFRLRYTGSALGYLWSLMKPLLIFAIMYVVFGVLLKVGGNMRTFSMQLLLGIVLWTFFSETTNGAMVSVVSNRSIIQKAYFPRWIIVLASSLSALITLSINLGIVMAGAAVLGMLDLHLYSISAILFLLELYVLALGAGLLLSSLFVYYRDLGHIWEILLQAGFFGSAIAYPLTFKPHFATVIGLNPVAQIINDMRHNLISSTEAPSSISVLGAWYPVPIAITLVVLALGIFVFNKLSPDFAENL